MLVPVGTTPGGSTGIRQWTDEKKTLQREYRNKLQALDIKYHGVPKGQDGPLVRRLETWGELQGLVVGCFGEGSQHLHHLLRLFAEAKVSRNARATGLPPLDSDISLTLAHYRRIMSTVAVRAQATCLLSRMGHLDKAAREAATRSTLAVRREAALRAEARAFHQAYVRGRGVEHSGDLVH